MRYNDNLITLNVSLSLLLCFPLYIFAWLIQKANKYEIMTITYDMVMFNLFLLFFSFLISPWSSLPYLYTFLCKLCPNSYIAQTKQKLYTICCRSLESWMKFASNILIYFQLMVGAGFFPVHVGQWARGALPRLTFCYRLQKYLVRCPKFSPGNVYVWRLECQKWLRFIFKFLYETFLQWISMYAYALWIRHTQRIWLSDDFFCFCWNKKVSIIIMLCFHISFVNWFFALNFVILLILRICFSRILDILTDTYGCGLVKFRFFCDWR